MFDAPPIEFVLATAGLSFAAIYLGWLAVRRRGRDGHRIPNGQAAILLTAVLIACTGLAVAATGERIETGPGDPCPQDGISFPAEDAPGWDPAEVPTFADLAAATDLVGVDVGVLPPELAAVSVVGEADDHTGGAIVRGDVGIAGDPDDVIDEIEERIETTGNPSYTFGSSAPLDDPDRSILWELTAPGIDPSDDTAAERLVLKVRSCGDGVVAVTGIVSFGPERMGDCAGPGRHDVCTRMYEIVPDLGSVEGELVAAHRVMPLEDGRLQLEAAGRFDPFIGSDRRHVEEDLLDGLAEHWQLDGAKPCWFAFRTFDDDCRVGPYDPPPDDQATTYRFTSQLGEVGLELRIVATPVLETEEANDLGEVHALDVTTIMTTLSPVGPR